MQPLGLIFKRWTRTIHLVNAVDAKSLGPGSLSSLRHSNQRRILDCLEPGLTLSQADLARTTGLAPSTVSNLVQRLVAQGVLATAPLNGRSIGVKLARGSEVAVGGDVGHRHITVAVGTRAGRVIAERRVDTGANSSAAVATDVIAELVLDALAEVGLGVHEPLGIGLGVPTPIDRA